MFSGQSNSTKLSMKNFLIAGVLFDTLSIASPTEITSTFINKIGTRKYSRKRQIYSDEFLRVHTWRIWHPLLLKWQLVMRSMSEEHYKQNSFVAQTWRRYVLQALYKNWGRRSLAICIQSHCQDRWHVHRALGQIKTYSHNRVIKCIDVQKSGFESQGSGNSLLQQWKWKLWRNSTRQRANCVRIAWSCLQVSFNVSFLW